ncbi:MAG: dihydrofolate reductase family protein [bacterium]
MRKLIMWNLITLDGFFEGPKSWELDWHNDVWGAELEKFSLDTLKSTGVLLFGRITYEGMASHWTTATGKIADFMNSIPKIVFSKTLKKADWNNTTLVNENAVEEVTKLKQQSVLPAGGSGKDLNIFGSANLSSTFMQHRLIDEYRLCLTPLILGRGNPLFKTNPERMKMRLVETRPLQSSGVILRYQPVPV